MEFDINQKIVKKAVEYYGEDYMTTVCMEECAELIQAISKEIRGKSDIEHLTEEMADVTICLEMLKQIYDIKDDDLEKWIEKKQERIKARITSSYKIGSKIECRDTDDLLDTMIQLMEKGIYTKSNNNDNTLEIFFIK